MRFFILCPMITIIYQFINKNTDKYKKKKLQKHITPCK